MKVLLCGASGFIGSNIAAVLHTSGHQIRAVSRRSGLDFTQMLSPSDWQPHLQDIDAVINAVGIIGQGRTQRFATLHTLAPIALFQACQQAGVKRVLQISALGADDSAASAYHLSKRSADDFLRELDLNWFVLRPSLVYGKGGKSTQLFMRMAALPRIPVIGDGQQALQPIHIEDLVATVLQALTASQSQQTLDTIGTETFSFAQWLQRMRQAQGLAPAQLIHCPLPLAMGLARLARHLNPMFTADNLRMLQRGYRGDSQALTHLLGRPPLPNKAQLFFADCKSRSQSKGKCRDKTDCKPPGESS